MMSVMCISIKRAKFATGSNNAEEMPLSTSHLCKRLLFHITIVLFFLCSRHRLYFHFSHSLVPCDKVIGKMRVAKATALSWDVSG